LPDLEAQQRNQPRPQHGGPDVFPQVKAGRLFAISGFQLLRILRGLLA
jgi:hypothetical protein